MSESSSFIFLINASLMRLLTSLLSAMLRRFERVWRGLKSRPDLFAQYVACFKKSTYKKVLKEALSPDLVSFMWRSLQEHSPGPQAQLRALAGFSSAPSFGLTLSLLPAPGSWTSSARAPQEVAAK
jgi:hypothetical protein